MCAGMCNVFVKNTLLRKHQVQHQLHFLQIWSLRKWQQWGKGKGWKGSLKHADFERQKMKLCKTPIRMAFLLSTQALPPVLCSPYEWTCCSKRVLFWKCSRITTGISFLMGINVPWNPKIPLISQKAPLILPKGIDFPISRGERAVLEALLWGEGAVHTAHGTQATI